MFQKKKTNLPKTLHESSDLKNVFTYLPVYRVFVLTRHDDRTGHVGWIYLYLLFSHSYGIAMYAIVFESRFATPAVKYDSDGNAIGGWQTARVNLNLAMGRFRLTAIGSA